MEKIGWEQRVMATVNEVLCEALMAGRFGEAENIISRYPEVLVFCCAAMDVDPPLHWVADSPKKNGGARAGEFLIMQARRHRTDIVNLCVDGGDTPLHIVACAGDSEAALRFAKVLLRHHRINDQETALLFRGLLGKGARKQGSRIAPCEIAEQNGYRRMAKLLRPKAKQKKKAKRS